MLIFLSLTGFVVSIILFRFNARNNRSILYLSGFFLLLSFYVFIQYVIVYSKSAFLVSVFYMNFTFLFYLVGPLFYWYIRSFVTDQHKLRKIDLLHLLPTLIFLAISLPYIFTSYTWKFGIAESIVARIDNIVNYYPTILHRSIPNLFIFLSRPVIILVYVLWSAVILVRYLVKKKYTWGILNQRQTILWHSHLIGFILLLVISQIHIFGEIFSFGSAKLLFTMNVLQIVSCFGLTGLLIIPFFFPAILYGLPGSPKPSELIPGKEDEMLQIPGENRRVQVFESGYILHIQQKIDDCMTRHQPYLKEDFNLTHLSAIANIPVHHLAYYFRIEKKQAFTVYRNHLRIEYAKNLIRDGRHKDLTLEAIGLMSGFSTRKTFIASFKKVEGILPSAFIARSSGESSPN